MGRWKNFLLAILILNQKIFHIVWPWIADIFQTTSTASEDEFERYPLLVSGFPLNPPGTNCDCSGGLKGF